MLGKFPFHWRVHAFKPLSCLYSGACVLSGFQLNAPRNQLGPRDELHEIIVCWNVLEGEGRRTFGSTDSCKSQSDERFHVKKNSGLRCTLLREFILVFSIKCLNFAGFLL